MSIKKDLLSSVRFLSHRTSYGRMWEANRNRDGSVSDSD